MSENAHTASAGVPLRGNLREFVCSEIWGGNRSIRQAFELPGVQGRVVSRPAEGGRGGDIHYVSICTSGLLSRLCVADVAGHGASVAGTSRAIHRLLRKYMNSPDQRRVLGDLNRTLEKAEFGVMTTAALISYFPPARMLSLSYAGHPPAWLYRRSTGRWERLELASARKRDGQLVDMPLAVEPDTQFTRRIDRVAAGDRLLLVTDGILEAPAPDGELFGIERLEAVLAGHGNGSADRIDDTILDAVTRHTGDPTLSHDDLTLIVAEFVAGPPLLGLWSFVKNRFLRPRGRPHGSGKTDD